MSSCESATGSVTPFVSIDNVGCCWALTLICTPFRGSAKEGMRGEKMGSR